MWIDWDYPQSAVALHIYRVGRSVPIRSRNPNKTRVKIQLLIRIGCFRPVWSVSKSVWPLVRPGCKSSGRHNFLIQTPNWTFYIGVSIISTRSTQWWSQFDNLTKLYWPVYMTGLTRLSSKPELCQFWVSTTTSDWKQQAKDFHMWVQHQTAQGEKNYETKYEFYNLLQCEYEEQCKDACFFFWSSYQQINKE